VFVPGADSYLNYINRIELKYISIKLNCTNTR